MFTLARRVVVRSAALACSILGLAGPANAQSGPDLLTAAKSYLRVSAAAVVNLQIDRTFGRALAVSVPFDGQMHALEFVPNTIRTPDYRLLEVGIDGIARQVKAGPENSLIGRVADIPDSEIAGGMMPDGLYCTILLPDGSRYWIESIESRVPGAQPGDHVIYRGGDVIRDNHRCGGTVEHGAQPVQVPGFMPRDTNLYTATLACDADYEFWAQYGSTQLVQNRITLVINTMNLQYRREVNIKHLLGTIVVRISAQQPYTQTQSSPLLGQVRTEWLNNQTNIIRNVVQMFTGKQINDFNPDGSTTIGLAWDIGQICNTSAFCFVWSNFNGNFSSATDLSAHELGHLWGGCHCSCDGSTRVSRYTMNPNITSINRFGPSAPNSECGNTTTTEIVAYRINRFLPSPGGAGCLNIASGGETAANDDCANAFTIGTSTIMAMGNIYATTDGPTSSCRSTAGNDVWYTLTAPCTANLLVETCSSSFDTVLTAYSGVCGALTEVACNDDATAGNCSGTVQSYIYFPITAGLTYHIKVSGYNGATGTGYLHADVIGCGSPSADHCWFPDEVKNGVPKAFTTIGAYTDGFADTLCNASGNSQIFQDVWYFYNPVCDGPVRVATCDADFDTRVAVYHFGGSDCPGPDTAIACNDDDGPACSGTRASLIFNAQTGGPSYYIRVGGYLGAAGSGHLTVDSLNCPRPSNDDCAQATTVQNGSVILNDFFAATNDGACDCGGAAMSRDVWFSFTAPNDGFLTVSTCGTSDLGGVDTGVDTVMSIHSGCPGNAANQIACNDDASSSFCGSSDTGQHHDSALTVPLTFAQNVRIRVANYNNAVPPTKQIRFNVSFAPANDNCAAAPTIGEGLRIWYNSNATDDGPPVLGGACGFTSMRNDVWHRYIPTCTGTARVSLCGTPFDTVVAVYSGPCGSPGTPIACNDDNGPACAGSASSADFPVTAGQAYLIRTGSYSVAGTGSGFLGVTCTAAAAGACCSGATCSVVPQGSCSGAFRRFVGPATACNAPGNALTPCCKADFNQDGVKSIQDLFDYLSAWFGASLQADTNANGQISVQDLFDFLAVWFAGC